MPKLNLYFDSRFPSFPDHRLTFFWYITLAQKVTKKMGTLDKAARSLLT